MSEELQDYLRKQRDNPSVLKTKLATIRSKSKCLLVFVMEGEGDLPVYEVWISRVLGQRHWEPLPARGKTKLLEFRQMLGRDQSGLDVCTYFIVDHDYDGLRGGLASDDTYVLPGHSAENFLVTEDVVDSILRSDFGMSGQLTERESILGAFAAARSDFIDAFLPACKRLWAGVGIDLESVRVRDTTAGVEVLTNGIRLSDPDALAAVVEMRGELPQERIEAAGAFFASREPEKWIRGKFAIKFMSAWFSALVADRRSEQPTLFPRRDSAQALPSAALDVRNLAGRASPPEGLLEFLRNSAASCRQNCVDGVVA